MMVIKLGAPATSDLLASLAAIDGISKVASAEI
jgi:hypothetical protein